MNVSSTRSSIGNVSKSCVSWLKSIVDSAVADGVGVGVGEFVGVAVGEGVGDNVAAGEGVGITGTVLTGAFNW